MTLPDVDSGSWSGYQADQFTQSTDARIATIGTPPPPPIRDDWAAPSAPAVGAQSSDVSPAADSVDAAPNPPTAVLPAPSAPITAPLIRPPVTPSSPVTAPLVAPQSGDQDYVSMALNAADQAGVDPALYASLVQQESNMRQTRADGSVLTSPAGARGLAQLMPATARGLGVNPDDPQQNLLGGAKYLRQLLDQFGGDVTKALAAYNAGPGAVQQYGGIPPYKETQGYVDSILSRVAAGQQANPAGGTAPGPTEALGRVGQGISDQPQADISQFGDPQLTSTEAYAACGPAAAVRFAERFGRNPTLREAVDLAKQVGWTPQQGMAGLGSEKALMDKLDVPTKLVSGPQWDTFANEAQTGNPVTISTAGHYFFADGYNAQTGAFHVGRSGLDLKGGAEWMTPTQMQNLMGPVQGGLLADNPTIPTPSNADQDTNPLDWLGRQKDALASGIGNAVTGAQDWTSGLGTASDAILGTNQPTTTPAASQPTPSDTLTNPTGTRYTLSASGQPMGDTSTADTAAGPSTAAPSNPLEVVKQKFGDAIDAIGSLLGGAVAGGQTKLANQGITLGTPEPLPAEPTSANIAAGAQDVALNGPISVGRNALEAIGQTAPVQAVNQARQAVAPMIGEPGNPIDTLSELQQKYQDPSDPLNLHSADRMTPQDLDRYNQAHLAVAGTEVPETPEAGAFKPQATPDTTAPSMPAGAAEGATATAAKAAPYQSVMPSGTFEPPAPPADTGGLGGQVATVQRTLTRLFTDRQVDINQAQEAYAKALGRPLNADEMAAELQRLSADPAAEVKIDEGLKPAIQSVGDDYTALRDYVTLRSNIEVAQGLGNEARAFSGGMSAADSQSALDAMQAQLGPQRFAKVQQAADQVTAFNQSLRQRLVDSQVLSQDQAQQMEALYPNWAKTRILDYMADPAGGQGAGTKIGLSDRQLRSYTLQGTNKAREDPLASTVAYAHQVERMANKNDAFNAFLNIDQASPAPMLRQVAQDFTPTKNQVTMIGFVNGEKQKFVTDNRALGEAINGAGVMSVPSWASAWQNVFKSLATSRNPLFLAGNAALDIPTYTFRTAIRDGGPQALPGIMSDLAKGYAGAFRGLLQGEYRGATADFLKGGGGQSGYFTGNEGQAAQAISDLRRSNVFQISGKADLLRLTKDVLTLKPVEAIGERVELGPRVAAYNRALARGANPVQAVIEGRTVTVDFSQGGTFTKYLNNFVPFFNVAAQGPVQLARAWRDNPSAFLATTGTLIGLPTVAAEVWNRADPQRARDYADIPDYVKNQGIVVMLPGTTPVDAQGNRKPLYAVLKLREWTPFAAIARDVTARALGDNSRNLSEMVQDAGAGLSPTNASSVGSLGSEAMSGIPVAPAALQLEQNRDFFRNRDIVTNRNDQTASALAKTLTPALQAAVDKLGYTGIEIRPSAVDFFIRNQGAGVGGAVLGGSDLAAGTARQDTSPTSLPGVGGLVGRFVGNQTGQGMQTARDTSLTPSARQILRQNGITTTPGPASSSVNQIPLKLDEETRYQQLTDQYVDAAIHRVASSPDFARMTSQGKNSLMQGAIDAARQKAGGEVLNTIPAAEKQQRLRTKSTAPSAPVGAGATP